MNAQNRDTDRLLRPAWRFGCILFLAVLAQSASAHNPDTSYCKVTITGHEVVCKFTYDLLTLQRIVPLDANGDGQLTRAEMEAAFPAIIRFLRERVYLDLNQREAEFAEADPLSWPEKPDTSIPKSDFPQRLLNITFHNPLLSAPEDVTLTFDFFDQLGEAHTVLGAFERNGHDDEVIFTRFEPD